MSDYVRNKSVMYPIDSEIADEIDGIIKDPFEIECFDDGEKINYYLSYNLYHTYGEESGDFGRNRTLSKNEKKKYRELFSEYLENVEDDLLKYVDYCWYNCCECYDYYLNKSDDFDNEI